MKSGLFSSMNSKIRETSLLVTAWSPSSVSTSAYRYFNPYVFYSNMRAKLWLMSFNHLILHELFNSAINVRSIFQGKSSEMRIQIIQSSFCIGIQLDKEYSTIGS